MKAIRKKEMRMTPEEEKELNELKAKTIIVVPCMNNGIYENKKAAKNGIKEIYTANSTTIAVDEMTEENYKQHERNFEFFSDMAERLMNSVSRDIYDFPDTYLNKKFVDDDTFSKLSKKFQSKIKVKRTISRGKLRNSAILNDYYLLYTMPSVSLSITQEEVKLTKAKYALLSLICKEILKIDTYQKLKTSNIIPPLSKKYVEWNSKLKNLEIKLGQDPHNQDLKIEIKKASAYLAKVMKYKYRPIDYLVSGLKKGLTHASMTMLEGILEYHLQQELYKIKSITQQIRKLSRRYTNRLSSQEKYMNERKIKNDIDSNNGKPSKNAWILLGIKKSTYFDTLARMRGPKK